MFFLVTAQRLDTRSLAEQVAQAGYAELDNKIHEAATFTALYEYFDEFIVFLQTNPAWAQKLYNAKERFIRSQHRSYYATDFFGFYDESNREGRRQISFYYATHFHRFMCTHYPECKEIPAIMRFFELCCQMQKPYERIVEEAAAQLGLPAIFTSHYDHPPILFKVVKYLPSYRATRPHYDGTAFSLLLHSTDNQALLLSPYKSSYTVDDFICPFATAHHHLILLIPGTLLTEFSIYPTPHIVSHSGNTRYATVAFALRPNYIPQKNECSPLPSFKTIE